MNKKIDTDKYESMRLLFLDFIDSASDEVDEEAWRNKLTMLDELLAEVKQLREELRITQSNLSIVRNALARGYPDIEEAIWKLIGEEE